jgi:ligand-binding SRPBCC domain-containing protein
MAVFSLKSTQQLPISLDQAWAFFSAPQNLKKITPPHLGFDIKSDPEWLERTYPGQIICYTVKPLLGIPLFWMTEITQLREKEFFVDEQRSGPYALWHHQHHFKAIPGGVEMTDLVHYKLPLGWIGRIAHWLFVRRQIEGIFSYRSQLLEKLFGQLSNKKTDSVLNS